MHVVCFLSSGTDCSTEMTTLMTCYARNAYKDTDCGKEIKAFITCTSNWVWHECYRHPLMTGTVRCHSCAVPNYYPVGHFLRIGVYLFMYDCPKRIWRNEVRTESALNNACYTDPLNPTIPASHDECISYRC